MEDSELIDELAYLATSSGIPTSVFTLAKKHNLSRQKLLELVTTPDFLEKLRGYSFLCLYLPLHKEIQQKRLDLAKAGSLEFAESTYKEYMGEGKDVLSLTETREIRGAGVKSLVELLKEDGRLLGVRTGVLASNGDQASGDK
jgi:hypothetical protein